jgi:xanthine dehydrogenase YagS FAD-binding subunit
MLDFAYASASDRNSVVAALSDPGAAIIAGGTELLNWMRLGIESPERLVDIGGLHDLEQISSDGQRLTIGARATLNVVAEHEQVRRHAGVLAEACLRAASAQVRNRATIGGNVLQKTRCSYFRAETPLPGAVTNARPAPAVQRGMASTSVMRSSGGRMTVSRCSRLIRQSRWRVWMRRCRCWGRVAAGRSR